MLVRNVQGTSLEVWPADLPKSRAAREAELQRLSTVVGIPVKQLEARIREHADDPLTPVVIRRGIHDDQVSYVLEHQEQFPGVWLQSSFLRKYPHRTLAAHVLGHVGEINAEELKAMKTRGYSSGDWIGQAGVEATYDSYLRGRDGEQEFTVDSRGRQTSPIETTVNPRRATRCGSRSTSASSRRPSRRCARASSSPTRAAAPAGRPNGGAIVAIDPRDGSVLALASYPTFEPSIYVEPRPAQARAAPERQRRAKKNHPGPEPRARRASIRRARRGSR